jgi:NAD(P)-dependent dehydrogenase (short-subunit alcohol dehydrogenase family)
MPLDGKVALVTGASRGIGADIAKYLGRAGCAVAVAARSEEVTDPRLPGTIYTVAKEIEDAGGRAVGVRMDMRNPESIADGVAKAAAHFGRIDILVNNAALLVPGTIDSLKERHIDLLWEVDLRGPIYAIRQVLPHMRAAGGGQIINISSAAAVFPGPGPYANARKGGWFYGLLKAALERMTQGLAMELQDDKIAVNSLSPRGVIRTPGNAFGQNDRENPRLDFEEATLMGKAAVWICEQEPPSYTGNLVFDTELCGERGL